MKKLLWMFLPFLFSGMAHARDCCECSCNPDCCKPKPEKQKPKTPKQKPKMSNKDLIKQEYGKIAQGTDSCVPGAECCAGGCCGGGSDLSQYLGYSEEELKAIPEANFGLGCGHPVSLGEIKAGDVILDLGSGAGIDCFIAAKIVGQSGKVIGVDMTPAMIAKAQENAKKYNIQNVEFRLGEIENLPVKNGSIDIIISNCVINLSDDKDKVFQEAHRVLKPGGKMYVSDVVLLEELTPAQRTDPQLICACIGGALLQDEYIKKLETSGFIVEIIDLDTEINKKWFGNDELPIASLKFIAHRK